MTLFRAWQAVNGFSISHRINKRTNGIDKFGKQQGVVNGLARGESAFMCVYYKTRVLGNSSQQKL